MAGAFALLAPATYLLLSLVHQPDRKAQVIVFAARHHQALIGIGQCRAQTYYLRQFHLKTQTGVPANVVLSQCGLIESRVGIFKPVIVETVFAKEPG